MSTQENLIKDLIIAKAKERNEIAGSVIGYSIRRDLNVDMKREYGGLKRFIREHCAGEVEWSRKKGGDDIFSHVSNQQGAKEIESEKEDYTFNDRRYESFWKVFSNPKIKKELLLNTTTGLLSIANNSAPVPEAYILIEKITDNEHRQMAQDFLAQIDDSKKSEFQQALSYDDFWPYWSASLRKYRHDGLLKAWLNWRDVKVSALFESRLRLAKLPDGIIDGASQELKHSLDKQTKPRQSYASTGKQLESINEPLRNIIHAIIDKMGEDELRRIWLPIGLLSDVLKQNNHKG